MAGVNQRSASSAEGSTAPRRFRRFVSAAPLGRPRLRGSSVTCIISILMSPRITRKQHEDNESHRIRKPLSLGTIGTPRKESHAVFMTNVFPWHRYTWRSMARTALVINHSEIAVSELRTNRRGHCVMAACRRGNIHATVGTVRVLRTEGFSCPKANSAQQFSESRVGAQVVKS